ncbi:hypothetical protein NDK25_23680 [Niallia taxi]|nr:hypothetical protein [Niallia taxi]MDE5055219.1 hypothetical protein [Niallia taxi]
MKKPLVILTTLALSTTLYVSSSASAAEETSETIKPYNYSEVIKNNFGNLPDEIKNEESQDSTSEETVVAKTYLTTEEVLSTDFNKLAEIHEKFSDEIESGKYTEAELNSLVAKEIKKESTGNKLKSAKASMNVSAKAASDYEIPGFGPLTDKEVALAKKHPIEFTSYGTTAILAKNESEKYYGKSQLYQGNGDAFRHSFWNAIMVPYFGGSTNGPQHGYNRAKEWANAHEQNSTGIDLEMDLMNNEIGRYYAITNYTKTNAQYSSAMRSMVKQGTMARIVNNQLTATNGTTGK